MVMSAEVGRREFLKAVGVGGGALFFSSLGFAAGKAGGPDVLLIMPDQMRGD